MGKLFSSISKFAASALVFSAGGYAINSLRKSEKLSQAYRDILNNKEKEKQKTTAIYYAQTNGVVRYNSETNFDKSDTYVAKRRPSKPVI